MEHGVAQQILDLTDSIIDATSEDITLPEKSESEQFIKRRFVVNPYKNSQSVSEVYDLFNKLNTKNKDSSESGIELTTEEMENYDKLKKAKDTFLEINKRLKKTQNSLSMSASEKRQKIDELQALRTDTARYYLGKDLINEKNKMQIELYEYYPESDSYVYKPNKLTKVTVEYTEEDKKKYAEICKEEYEDAISKLEKKASYKKASTEEQEKMRDSELTKARNTAKETVSEEVYKRNKGAK